MNQFQASISSMEDNQNEESTTTSGDLDQVGFKRAETFSAFDNKLKPVGGDQPVNRAQSMKTERTGRSYNRQLPGAATAASSPDTGSPLTKHKRRGSGGSGKGWSIRSKSKDEKDINETKGKLVHSFANHSIHITLYNAVQTFNRKQIIVGNFEISLARPLLVSGRVN